ncbi:MAG: LysR substrate-binding domain-containing protein, partial [Burkholderiaceae bacterium]
VSPQTSTTTLIERCLADSGLRRRIALRVPHFMVVPEIVQATDLIAIVPSYVRTYTRSMPDLKMLPLPIPVPRFEVKQFWHQRQHRDPMNRWMRELVAELFTQKSRLSS